MADVRPFRGLRYNTAAVDPSLTIAPPYDVISDALQQELYERSPQNIVRIEYARDDDGEGSKYDAAAAALQEWVAKDVLVRDDAPAIYAYRQEFEWDRRRHVRHAWFGAVRLERWDAGVIKPHEFTLKGPKEDRMRLLRATQAQVSPVYSLFRPERGKAPEPVGERVVDAQADGQRHTLTRVSDERTIATFANLIAKSDVYIADGHHRYETALAYRDEVRSKAASWSGDEPENFVLMALTAVDDPGLLVLPTHRVVHVEPPRDAVKRLSRHFGVTAVTGGIKVAQAALENAGAGSFVAVGLSDAPLLLRLRDQEKVAELMPRGQSEAWIRLDVNVLQYGVLLDVCGIDDARLAAGGAVTYTQDAGEAAEAVATGDAHAAFLLNATPVEQVLAVADAGGRMPQKSTFFHPKLPTGLVLRPLD